MLGSFIERLAFQTILECRFDEVSTVVSRRHLFVYTACGSASIQADKSWAFSLPMGKEQMEDRLHTSCLIGSLPPAFFVSAGKKLRQFSPLFCYRPAVPFNSVLS